MCEATKIAHHSSAKPQAVSKAQEELLAKANKQKFDLETEIKLDKHKVQRLRDYENRIDQLTKMLRMWYAYTFNYSCLITDLDCESITGTMMSRSTTNYLSVCSGL